MAVKIVLNVNAWAAKTPMEFEMLADDMWDMMRDNMPAPDSLFLINEDGVTMAIRNRGVD